MGVIMFIDKKICIFSLFFPNFFIIYFMHYDLKHFLISKIEICIDTLAR